MIDTMEVVNVLNSTAVHSSACEWGAARFNHP